jgi:hypothetical protein
MRFVLTIGRMTLFDFTLFRIEEVTPMDDPDVVVVHHYNDGEDDEDKPDGPDLFGKP